MKTKVAYITTARSDYGPSYWVIHDLFADKRFDMTLIVSGSHLSAAHGNTYREIKADHWPNVLRVPFLGSSEGTSAIGRGAGRALAEFSRIFYRLRPDIVILYGDRYELLPIASAALIACVPIAHFCGGDITEGAFDNQVRHAVTKMAHLHFPSTRQSAGRIRQMGEEPWRIHTVGDPALDQFLRSPAATKSELSQLLGFTPNRDTLLVTLHPETLELDQLQRQARELSMALRAYTGSIVITAPAPDPGADTVRKELEVLARSRPQTRYIESLGSRRYRGLLAVVGAMVGNSSSGLIEAPYARLPVVNIGSRQAGRERARNVIDVSANHIAITQGIQRVLGWEFRESLKRLRNPYGTGHAAQRAVKVLQSLPPRSKLLSKRFHAGTREMFES